MEKKIYFVYVGVFVFTVISLQVVGYFAHNTDLMFFSYEYKSSKDKTLFSYTMSFTPIIVGLIAATLSKMVYLRKRKPLL